MSWNVKCHEMLLLMLMLDLWPQVETPGVTHFGAYHRPPDGHFLLGIECLAGDAMRFWIQNLVLKMPFLHFLKSPEMCQNGPDSALLLRVLTQRIVNSGSFFNLWNQMQEVFAGNQNFCRTKFLITAGYSLLLVTWFHFPVHNLWIGITDWRESQSKD